MLLQFQPLEVVVADKQQGMYETDHNKAGFRSHQSLTYNIPEESENRKVLRHKSS
jgi:hypothetical protein